MKNIFGIIYDLINLRHFGLLTSSLVMFFTLYLNYRQYNYLQEIQTKKIIGSSDFQAYCGTDMTLQNWESEYPKCPEVMRKDFFKYEFSQYSQRAAMMTQCVRAAVPIYFFSSNLYPRLMTWLNRTFGDFLFASYLFYRLPLEYTISLLSCFILYRVVYIYQPKYILPEDKGFINPEALFMYACILPLFSVVESLMYDLFQYVKSQASLIVFGIFGLIFSVTILFYSYTIYLESRNNSRLAITSFSKDLSPLAEKVGFPVHEIYIVESSENDSEKGMRAFATGGFGYYRIFFFDGITKLFTIPELQSVLCHELGHWLFSHLNLRYISLFTQWILFQCLEQHYFDCSKRAASFRLDEKPFNFNNGFLLVGFSTLIKNHKGESDLKWLVRFHEYVFVIGNIASLGIQIARAASDQAEELECDAFSVKFGHGNNLKIALTKLQEATEDIPVDPFVRACLATHPSVEKRHAHIDATIAQLSAVNEQSLPKPISDPMKNNRNQNQAA
jgi:Zn-dependent protease with chaperone function